MTTGRAWPFVGRRAELARVAGGSGPLRRGGVAVFGPAGAGRTEFARAATRELARRDAHVHWVVGSADARDTPLAAFAHLLAAGPAGGSDLALLVAATAALSSGPRRTVLVVDDAHLLDPLSATLVQQLVVGGGAGVLLTVEDGATVPDALRRLWKDGLVERIDLTWLTRAEVAELVAAAGTDADDAAVERLYGATGGAPRLLRGVVEDDAYATGQVGARVTESVAADLAALDADGRAALELVAFAGVIGLADLERAAGRAAVAALDARGLVAVARSRRRATVRVRVPVLADAVRAATSELRSDAVRATLADLASGRRSGDRLLRVSMLAAAGHELAAADLAAAARTATDQDEHDLAASLAARALDADPALPAARVAAAEVAAVAGEWDAAANADGSLVAVVAHAVSGDAPATRSAAARVAAADRDAAEAFAALVAGEPVGSGLDGPLGVAAEAYALACAGRTDEALAVAGKGDPTALAAPALDLARTTALRFAGRLDEATAYATEARARALATGARTRAAVGALLLGQVALDAGLPRTALRALREVAASAVPPVLVLAARCASAQADLLVGSAAAAAELAEAPYDGVLQPLVLLTLAWLAAVRGLPANGAALARDAAAAGGRAVRARALHVAVRIAPSDESAADLVAAADGCDGLLLPELGRHGAALLARDTDALETVAGRLAGTGARLLAADALMQAAGLRTRAGERSTPVAFARRLLAGCEGASTPLTAGTAPAPLTRREREIAMLAANGLSNRAIAERLVVSVRTVEGHLARAYAGLGVHGRGDLAAALGVSA